MPLLLNLTRNGHGHFQPSAQENFEFDHSDVQELKILEANAPMVAPDKTLQERIAAITMCATSLSASRVPWSARKWKSKVGFDTQAARVEMRLDARRGLQRRVTSR
jgi:hypothetical protein